MEMGPLYKMLCFLPFNHYNMHINVAQSLFSQRDFYIQLEMQNVEVCTKILVRFGAMSILSNYVDYNRSFII